MFPQCLGVGDSAERETQGASRVTGRVGDDDRMTLRQALEAGIERADEDGATKVKARHFHESEIDQILSACFDFLEARTAGPSPRFNGWLVTSGRPGLRKWLSAQAGLTGVASERLQVLRTEIYDLLEERGWIVKGLGHNVPIHLSPIDARHPEADASEVITVTPHGAGYGDPATNAQVEQVAMRLIADEFDRQGWTVDDVSMDKVGWDISVRRGDEIGHLEVKGVSGVRPTVLLTRNEHACGSNDPYWKLAVVTQALTAPILTMFSAQQVIDSCSPHVYRARLNQ